MVNRQRVLVFISLCFFATEANAINEEECGDPVPFILKIISKKSWPWMATVGIDMTFTNANGIWRAGNCDAILLNQEWALTSAECIRSLLIKYRGNPNIKRWSVRFGMQWKIRNMKVERSKFKKSRAIQNVHSNRMDPSVALVQLKSRTGYSNYIKPVCLPLLDQEEDMTTCSVVGYGTVNRRFSDLHSSRFNVQNCSYCKLKHRGFDCDKQICGEFSQPVIEGEKGGVLMCQSLRGKMYTWWAVGINVKPKEGKVFTRIDKLTSWINTTALMHSRHRDRKTKN